MGGFRDKIESSKQVYDQETLMKTAEEEFIDSYANFVAQSIRNRLLDVAQKITKGTTHEYRGVLRWDRIPLPFFELSSFRVKKWFIYTDYNHINITNYGQKFIDIARKQLKTDEITLNGPFFSRMPRMTDGDGYFLVPPIELPPPKTSLYSEVNLIPHFPYRFFIIDGFTKVKACEIPDKLGFPVDYRFIKFDYSQEVDTLENGVEHRLGKRLDEGEGPFLEISYRL